MFVRFAVTAFACLCPLMAVGEEILNVGDAAPPLTTADWIKGEKIAQFEPGKIYVIEFWATWCGPCRASIPHLTELAHQYKEKGVQFVGVDVWERDLSLVKPFVEEMGEKMDYNVALDFVPESGEAKDGAMAKNWLAAAEENGIPTAFVVQDKKIAWIGHPLGMDEPLAKITAGEWNVADVARQRLADKEKQKKLRLAREKIINPYRANDYAGTVVAIDEVAATDPEIAEEFLWLKFVALCKTGDIESALTLGSTLFEKYHDNAGRLNQTFWNVIAPNLKTPPDPRIAQLALKAAERAVELTGEKEPNYLDTLAEARFKTGNAAGAIEAEEKAIQLFKTNDNPIREAQLKAFNDHLERYRKGVEVKAAP